jgi:hypothetical protein
MFGLDFSDIIVGFICFMIAWSIPEPQWSKNLKAWARLKYAEWRAR